MDPATRDKLFPSARLFCNSEFLNTFQNTPLRRFSDSKTLVDLQLRCHPDEALRYFSRFNSNPSQNEYDEFMRTVFEDSNTGISLVCPFAPTDYEDHLPDFVHRIENAHPLAIDFISDLKGRWKDLCRAFIVKESERRSGVLSSLIALPHPFFIPGGRFQECYYWDTLWIVKGLVVCQMLDSAKGAVRNLFYMLDMVGFVPNGNRVYYLNRSQPPMLTEMVRIIHEAIPNEEGKLQWLKEAVPYLDKEYEWFRETHSCAVASHFDQLRHLSVSIYHVKTVEPRPESYNEDVATLRRQESMKLDSGDNGHLYMHLASAAESGWDFSSRWAAGRKKGLEGITTCDIVPCCLNSILLRMESTLAEFHDSLALVELRNEIDSDASNESRVGQNHTSRSQSYMQFAKSRKESMQELFWDSNTKFWFDYDCASGEHSRVVSCAGLMPLWAGCESGFDFETAEDFVEFVMKKSGLLGAGGLFCTTETSAEQWDFPNCWPPLVDIAVEAFNQLGEKYPNCGAREAAKEIATRFLNTAFRGWCKGQVMHEKYDARVNTGKRGEGGEYEPQTGFGWTNGTVLWLLKQYPNALDFNGLND